MEDRPSGLSSTTPSVFAARLLSVAGHPFLLIPLTIAISTHSVRWAAVIAAGMILPLTAIVRRNVRRGTWSDVDVSRQDQRAGLYRAAVPLLLLTAGALYLLGASTAIMRGVLAAAVMLAAGLLANRFLKVSMHMMFAAFCGVIMARVNPANTFWVTPFVAAIAWSRWKLERHTVWEIVVGIALGAIAGFCV